MLRLASIQTGPLCRGLLLPALLLWHSSVVLGESPCSEPAAYELLRVIEVAGRQGVATDGASYYVSGNASLYVYSKSGELLRKNEAALEGLPQAGNHIGDISFHDGEIFAGVEWFEDGQGKNIQVAVYDARTLLYKRSIPWEPASGQVEVSGVAIDAGNNSLWLTDWVNGNYLYRYELASGAYSGRLHLRAPPQWQQGIAFHEGFLYITADDGDAEDDEVDNLWRVSAGLQHSAAYVTHEFSFSDFRQAGEIEGITFDGDAGEMIVLANRGKRIVLGMPQGLYPGYDREIHELYVYQLAR